MSSELIVANSLLLGSGNERNCFIHPKNSALCIKVSKPGVVHREQNKIESYYFNKLISRKVPFDNIAKFYGQVLTNQGSGLIFERVLNSDGTPAETINSLVDRNKITLRDAEVMLDNLYQYLNHHSICLGDLNPDQILVKDLSIPIIIDGIGTRRYGLKLILFANIPFLCKYKIRKNWKTLRKKMRLD